MKRVLDLVRARAIDVDGCWEWQGALHVHGATPVVNFEGRVVAVRRLLALAANLPLEDRVASNKCGNKLCVRPSHVTTITRRELSLQTAALNRSHSSPVTRKKIAERARATARLTMELAREIREASGSQREIAARYGTSQKMVWLIKNGRAWLDYSNPFTQLIRGNSK